MKIEDFILLIKSSQLNAKFQHWQTIHYSTHIALDGYESAIGDLVDKFVESAQGKFGMRYNFIGKELTITDLSVENYYSQLSHQVTLMIEELLGDYPDLDNIGQEILAEINKLRYLLTLQ